MPVVLVFCLVAAIAFAAVVSRFPNAPAEQLQALLVLSALAIAAEFLNYQYPSGASGSIATIPFVSSVLLSPTAASVVVVAVTSVLVQILSRRHWIKAVFNVSQMVLFASSAVLVANGVGSVSLLTLGDVSLFRAAERMFLPALLVTATVIAVNTASVSAIVAWTQRKSYVAVLRAHAPSGAMLFAVTSLITFYFTWLYSRLGPTGAAGLAIPLLGIRQLYRTTMELTRVSEELLDLMVAAIEARDPYTSGHSKRVAKASRIIAEALGLKPSAVERVGVAALLHDVGKIDEAFAPILAKEGRLTPQEWELMKRHPLRSAELVALVSSLKDVVDPVRHHHENWDGTGYPNGLRGESIPLASRIIMFADTLDAMTTDRPYRKALAMEEARAEFLRFRGKQFDPSICDRIVQEDVWARLYASYVELRASQDARTVDAQRAG